MSSENTRPAATPSADPQAEMMQRMQADLIDSYDEELEMEIDDRAFDEGSGSFSPEQRAQRRAYFK